MVAQGRGGGRVAARKREEMGWRRMGGVGFPAETPPRPTWLAGSSPTWASGSQAQAQVLEDLLKNPLLKLIISLLNLFLP